MKKTFIVLVALVLAGTAQPAHAAAPSTVDPIALRDRLSRLAPPERTPATVDTFASIVGGNGIDNAIGLCTTGFMADLGGGRVALTAGHCTRAGGNWYRRGKFVGPTMGSVFGFEGDFGMVGIFFNYSAEPKVASYYSGSYGTQPVMGIETLPIPSYKLLCKTGRITGWTCGSVLAYDVTVTLRSGVVVGGMIETDICAAPGDSGSPLFTSAFVSNPPGAMAVGILSSGTDEIRAPTRVGAPTTSPSRRCWTTTASTCSPRFDA